MCALKKIKAIDSLFMLQCSYYSLQNLNPSRHRAWPRKASDSYNGPLETLVGTNGQVVLAPYGHSEMAK